MPSTIHAYAKQCPRKAAVIELSLVDCKQGLFREKVKKACGFTLVQDGNAKQDGQKEIVTALDELIFFVKHNA
jgi:hypothetical protein